ncbi:hypothetical protein ACFSJY_09015 [Thalassotalea euphylliae]|uniref:hypothetical protein n=1 Tax=Thalassotalea euphylliae TaxID=1655234 RepID=UPI003637DF04
MDIFTTQLTRVVPNKVEPSKLKVKNVTKESSLKAMDEEHEHLDEHEKNTVTHQHAEKQYQQHNAPDSTKEEDIEEQLEQVNRSMEGEEEIPKKHLDIFV